MIEPSRGLLLGARPSDLEQAPVKVVWLVGSCQETGVPLELPGSALEAIGFARMTPDEPIREDELEVVPPLRERTNELPLDGVLLLGRPFTRRVNCLSKLQWRVLHVVHDMSENEHRAWPAEAEIAHIDRRKAS